MAFLRVEVSPVTPEYFSTSLPSKRVFCVCIGLGLPKRNHMSEHSRLLFRLFYTLCPHPMKPVYSNYLQ